ncbi:T9SS type A sorting domain-containing protein [Bernardetia sp. Wsw4-3y2]|uniref:T9SS type A sorting domain-containing protein n=1 Tax=Bernardetia sp. Wsw4-3y2 TaxID=3127471 RepID=UPI0030CFEB21
MNKKYLLTGVTVLGISTGIFGYFQLNTTSVDLSQKQESSINIKDWKEKQAAKKAAIRNREGYVKTMEISGYLKYMNDIRTKEGEKHPNYKIGYRQLALESSLEATRNARTEEEFVFDERGPGNVAGRTRCIVVDVRDTSNNTWFIGTAGGGIWKTTDGGNTWTDKSGNMSHLGITSIAQAQSSPNIMYATTGETPFGNAGINGGGVFKSTDGGDTWNRINTTVPRITDFLHGTRVIVSPTDPNLVLVTSSYNPFESKGTDPEDSFTSNIFRSTNGGTSWTSVYNNTQRLQQIIAEPGNFNNMYAVGTGGEGGQLIRSTDAGLTWQDTPMTSVAETQATASGGVGRSELAISPTNPAIIYASVDIAGAVSRLLVSSDRGISWKIVEENRTQKREDYLQQGFYDNAIVVNPTDENTVYWGGVDLWKATINTATTRKVRKFLGGEKENLDFLSFTSVTGFVEWGGRVEIKNPSKSVTVEFRFGPGKSQKAHRFLAAGGGATSGVAASEYVYQDYVDVPFEVWDIENNRQLMFSFRDNVGDGEFSFTERDEANDPTYVNTREYMFVHAIPYETTPSDRITVNAGHEVDQIYFLWPFLTPNSSFSPTASSVLRLNYGDVTYQDSQITRMTHGRVSQGETPGPVSGDQLHVDHHMLTFAGSRLISVNDGGLGYSDNFGNSWKEIDNKGTNNVTTAQFYRADRHPTQDKYLGGTQDNGSLLSISQDGDASTDYKEVYGGDGMECVWHATNPNLMLVSYVNNDIGRSTDGGNSVSFSSTGISDKDDDNAPFVTRLGYSPVAPDVVFAVGKSGVFKSTNFGQTWKAKPIGDEIWNYNGSTTNIFPSLCDQNIVWAGSGMSQNRTMFLSKDGGETFSPVPNSINIGVSSGFATNPENRNEAYMLFGQAGVGKIWRTKNLGQSWEDISGFGQNTTSSKGFPDVVPFSMVVKGDTLLVGTEIGIMASYDDAASWSLVPNFPAVAVFSLVVKENDGQLVIGTHGRGIWSSDIGIKYDRITGILNPTDAISLKVYPNPTQDKVRFELPKITGNYDIRVYTITGQEVVRTSSKGGGNVELNIQKFVGGTYILKAIHNNKLYVQKVVLQK